MTKTAKPFLRLLRRYFMLAVVAMIPVAALANDDAPPAGANAWQVCEADTDCVLVTGICAPTAVNKGYQQEAVSYYKKRAASAKCNNQFWVPKASGVRCRIAACEAVVE